VDLRAKEGFLEEKEKREILVDLVRQGLEDLTEIRVTRDKLDQLGHLV